MDMKSELYELCQRVPDLAAKVGTEEATKHGLVLPFIRALGYNVFDPTEVVPEFVADIGEKKGEKVDYAILMDGKPILLFECKTCGDPLEPQRAVQLQRYFHGVASVRFGILTDGLVYQFYSDLERPNVMDVRPFLEVDLQDLSDEDVEQLRRFSKEAFNVEDILGSAGALKYTREIRQLLETEFDSPSEDFLKFLTRRVYDGNFTKAAVARFLPIVQRALREFVNARITRTLEAAKDLQAGGRAAEETESQGAGEELVTTSHELQGYYIVKAILSPHIDLDRIAIRDVRSYCGILLDDSNRKPICRLHFKDPTKLRLGLFNAAKEEERLPLQRVDDIYKYADRIRDAVRGYDVQEKA
jgi:hypothetical protein